MLETEMATTRQGDMQLEAALDHMRAALVHLDAANQHSAAAQLDHVIHEVQEAVNAASGAS